MHKRLVFTDGVRLVWLKIAVASATFFALIMGPKLWFTDRGYPYAPILPYLPPISHPLDWTLYGSMLLLLLAIIIADRPQKYIWAFLAIVGILCIYDQTRWQPYLYQYAFLLASLALYSWKWNDAKGRAWALNVARLIVASTYIWSGLQKANVYFVTQVFPWLVQPITHLAPALTQPLYDFGYLVPAIQVAFGIGLLTKRFRKVAVLLAVIMHLFILAMIGPWGLDWNSIVWPWTIAMACFDVLLFANADFSFREVLEPRNSVFHWLVLILFLIMPALSFVNLWDSDLSAALYSGNLTEGYIYMSDLGESQLPPSIRQYVIPVSPNNNVLPIKDWAVGDMNIIEYPETRVFKTIAASVCGYMSDPNQMYLAVNEARFFNSRPTILYRCSQL